MGGLLHAWPQCEPGSSDCKALLGQLVLTVQPLLSLGQSLDCGSDHNPLVTKPSFEVNHSVSPLPRPTRGHDGQRSTYDLGPVRTTAQNATEKEAPDRGYFSPPSG